MDGCNGGWTVALLGVGLDGYNGGVGWMIAWKLWTPIARKRIKVDGRG